MKEVKIEIRYAGKNFGAYVPQLDGCVATGSTPAEIKANIKEAIVFHIKGSLKDGDPVPKTFMGKYELVYFFDAESLLNYYKGIFTKSALMRITGINQQQLHHYSTGLKKPRPAQTLKIKTALHKLGAELLAVEL